jgi:hypothetical protein
MGRRRKGDSVHQRARSRVPAVGLQLLGPTVNSNSAYRTFGELMGIPVHDFPFGFAPGLRWRLITVEQTERLRFQAAAMETSEEEKDL